MKINYQPAFKSAKTILSLINLFFLFPIFNAQQYHQSDTLSSNREPLIKLDKVQLLNHVDVIANTQIGLNNNFADRKYTGSRFAVNQFRLEIKGNVFKDKVFFRFRDRYTRDPETQSVDNLSRSTDIAFVGYNISPKTSIAIGKMSANWGGYEFDMNPIDIYAYNDIVENADNFLTGIQFNWNVSKDHTLSAQVLNSRTRTFSELYGEIPGIEEAKFPAAYVGTWNGSFKDGMFRTLWSFSIFQEASKNGKPLNMYYTALGNQFSIDHFFLQYDFKWSVEDLDRKRIVSGIIPDTLFPFAAQNVYYLEHWLRAVYAINSNWKVSAIGMVSSSYWKQIPDEQASSKLIRNSWGIIPSLEFYPIKNYNLKFYLAYVGRKFNYSEYSKQYLGAVNNRTGMIMVGISSPLLIL